MLYRICDDQKKLRLFRCLSFDFLIFYVWMNDFRLDYYVVPYKLHTIQVNAYCLTNFTAK